MTTDNLGTLICRGIGLLLLILGFLAVLRPLLIGLTATTGWSSYAPRTPSQSFGLFVQYHLTDIIEFLLGVVLLVFSGPLGRLLAWRLSTHAA